ncbi:Signal peptidase I [Frankia canadensis]|uniref:Signal peptidase I n=1 Tax=Frankia canadensis TaxID=1836972 RepID=A0A2I2KQA5_9ACTN|nr:signal peptidase I [Frankia canadensis]SNQ47839.1 Signal peptidase I [Frankia canadensis]SOU55129.1 Signal peptidase I [Frankia canadensis]
MNASSPGGQSSDAGGDRHVDERWAQPRASQRPQRSAPGADSPGEDAPGWDDSPPWAEAAGASAADGDAGGPQSPGGTAAEPSGDDPGSARRAGRPGSGARGRGSFLRELPVLVLVAFLLALLIKALLVQAFWIPSESMERTLLVNDRVLVNKVVYHFRDVHRGEVVVFNGKGTGFDHAESIVPKPTNAFGRFVRDAQNLLGLGAPSETDFIKRVIGVGGDTVACCDAQGRVTVNGRPLDEPYVFENDYQRFGPVKVPKGYLWVMGDHRGASSDARQNGPIPQSKVVGRAFVRVWPLSRFGFLEVPGTFKGVPAAAGSPAPAELRQSGLAGAPGSSAPADSPALLALLALTPPAWRARRRGPARAPLGGRGADRRRGLP